MLTARESLKSASGIEKIEKDGFRASFIVSANVKLSINNKLYEKLRILLEIPGIVGFEVKTGLRMMSTMTRAKIAENDLQKIEVNSDEIWDEEKIEEVKKIIEKAIKDNT